ncbi:unnamed protein product [Paramecium pentaurelia]|uniref:Uncharacterized protein n=1 Tax=Paramecium pentaurelia TaxID=43138 RepID=A0A8S1YLP7_9CILI|nr:unnamed protein product [Paramecium pentaurelia]
MTYDNKNQFKQVLQYRTFEEFLTSIWNIFGNEIQQLLLNILREGQGYDKQGSYFLRIGTNLFTEQNLKIEKNHKQL